MCESLIDQTPSRAIQRIWKGKCDCPALNSSWSHRNPWNDHGRVTQNLWNPHGNTPISVICPRNLLLMTLIFSDKHTDPRLNVHHGCLTQNTWWPHGITWIVCDMPKEFAPMSVNVCYSPWHTYHRSPFQWPTKPVLTGIREMTIHIYTYMYIYYIYISVYILRNAPIQNAWVYIMFCAIRIKSGNGALGHNSIDNFSWAWEQNAFKEVLRSAVKTGKSIHNKI